MSVEETSKRALSASAPENDPKRLKEDATAPAWAVNLFSTMKNELKNDLTSVIDERMSRLEIINEQVNERCDDMEVKIDKNADDIAKLFAENKQLKEALAKCNDTNMRNSLTICGVKRAQGETFWSHTREALAVALEKMTPPAYDYAYWHKAIERAHRGRSEPGKTPVIHVRMHSWQDWELLTNLFKNPNVSNPDRVQIYEKYSEHTSDRRKLAIALRYQKKLEFPGCKAHVKYPADLYLKKVGEIKYTCIAKF